MFTPSAPRHWWSSRRERGDTTQAVQDAVRLLRAQGCPVCAERDEARARWFGYFVAESHSDEAVRAEVHAALGLCPGHYRWLLADGSASWLLPQVQEGVLAAGVRTLDARGAVARCPCCVGGDRAAGRTLHTLLAAYPDARVSTVLEGGVLCAPHLRDLLGLPGGELAAALVDPWLSAVDEWPVDLLVGTDPDGAARAAYVPILDALFASEDDRAPTLARWEGDTARACCPVCLARERANRRLLHWEARAEEGTGPRDAEVELCRRHLHDLARTRTPGARTVVDRLQDRAREQWRRFRTRQERGNRVEALGHLEAPVCRGCREERSAEDRYLALLAAVLLDPGRAAAHARSHGLCLRHVLRAGETLPVEAAGCVRTWLKLTRWEVTETLRKQEWHARHEEAGEETTAAFRSTTHLDGRIGCGLPRAQQPGADDDIPTEREEPG
ncbi:hypothetical protein [Streptomyces sp. GZWMJZ-114]|uniref:hypothetical protein n=1 Tax=Streptomyces sp. GZWMJZ-114 TaxID=2494734 RepID=UPI001013131C|nr:hypothetical protein [Streptomyces sp. GZWMJZ-114]